MAKKKHPHLSPYDKRLVIEALPRWAQQLLRARYVRRVMENFECACPERTGLDALERVAIMLETGQATRENRAKLRSELELLLDRFDVPELRGPIVTVQGVCDDDDRYLSDTDGPGDAATNRKDRKLLDRTEQRDLRILQDLSSKDRPPGALDLLGPLWPLGEPQWKRAVWPTLAQMRARQARVWGDDEPPMLRRSAKLPLSNRVPEVLHVLFNSGPFELVYRAQYESTTLRGITKGRGISTLRPRDHKIRFPTPGQHRFREPCDPQILRKFRTKIASGPTSLRFLAALYREHDGGLLFQPVKGKEEDAHIDLYGLEDQDHAMELLRYHLQGDDPDGPQFDRLCAKLGCELEDAICLAIIDASFFIVPLKGKCAGRVFRFSARARRLSEFARTVERAMLAFASKICALSGEFGPVHAIGDEAKGAVSELRLAAIKRPSRKRAK